MKETSAKVCSTTATGSGAGQVFGAAKGGRLSAPQARAGARGLRDRSAHGDKAHIAADKDTGIIRAVETTPANEADVSAAPSIIPDASSGENSASGILGGQVFGDKAYAAASVKQAIKAKGGSSELLRNGPRWLAPKKFLARNRKLAPIRARIAKIFGTWKRSYRFRAMRWVRLAKCQVQSSSRGQCLQFQALLAA